MATSESNNVEPEFPDISALTEELERNTTKAGRILQMNGLLVSIIVGLLSFKSGTLDLEGITNLWMIAGILGLAVSTICVVLALAIGIYDKPVLRLQTEGCNKEAVRELYQHRIRWSAKATVGGVVVGFTSAPLLIAGFLSAAGEAYFFSPESLELPIGALVLVATLPTLTWVALSHLQTVEESIISS